MYYAPENLACEQGWEMRPVMTRPIRDASGDCHVKTDLWPVRRCAPPAAGLKTVVDGLPIPCMTPENRTGDDSDLSCVAPAGGSPDRTKNPI